MIARYCPQVFSDLWSDQRKYETWLSVELAACEAMESMGFVPKGTALAIKNQNIQLDPSEIERIERTTRHDVIAFLTHVESLAGPPARWLHRGMTSSDVLDTSFALLLKAAADLLLERMDRLIEVFAQRARQHARTPMIGRSHGIFAEPVSFGLVLAGHLAELKRAKLALARGKDAISVGKIAGAVGTYAHLSPDVEQHTLNTLGLRSETVATQVVARDRHATFFMALALVAAAIERFATNVRQWQRSEVGEAEERFSKGQKGSSAMPHKRNPVLSENLCGLARVVRAAVTPALENVALWHERDISHSSVERVIAPQATSTLGFMLERATGVVEGLVAYPERMEQNLARANGLFFSEAVMLALLQKGLRRQQAYEIVQKSAMAAFAGEGDFLELLGSDPEVTQHLSTAELKECFDLDHALRYAETIVKRAISS